MKKREPYIKLPIRYLHETDWTTAIIRAYIDGFVDSDKALFQTQDEIAKTLDCVRKTISRKTQILCEKNMVLAKRTQKGIVYLPISDVTDSHTSDETDSPNGKRLKVPSDETDSPNDNKDDIKIIYKNNIQKGGNRAPACACEAPPENPPSDKEKKIEEIVLAKWNAHYRRHYSTEYIPDYRSITNDTAVIADAVRKKMTEHGLNPGDTDDVKQFCDDLFESFRTVADLWQRQHWTLHTIATQFNELYNRIINGNNPDPDNNTTTNRPGKGQRRISDAAIKEAMLKAAGIVRP